ncbi:MAG: LysR family transcriptional activator of dmlA [Flavobacteriales bacterium]|jgi:LysR family transcriptional activator of dmlA
MALKSDNSVGLVLFSQINKHGSLSAAAEVLGISRSSVSKQLAALERQIGSRLLNRTTRKFVLTEVGRQVLQEAHKVEHALQAIEHISEDYQSEIAGSLKMSCPSAQGRTHLLPLLVKFLDRYPKLTVNLQLDDRFVDMSAENIDLSIRIGYLPDSTLIARKLGELTWELFASPEYLRQAPPLTKPTDLVNHRCLFYQNSKIAMNNWAFCGENGEESIAVTGPLAVNDPGALVSAAVAHAGVLLIDKSLLGDTVLNGQLVPVLKNYKAIGGLPMYIIYPEKEYVPAKTRTLINFLLEEFSALFDSEEK